MLWNANALYIPASVAIPTGLKPTLTFAYFVSRPPDTSSTPTVNSGVEKESDSDFPASGPSAGLEEVRSFPVTFHSTEGLPSCCQFLRNGILINFSLPPSLKPRVPAARSAVTTTPQPFFVVTLILPSRTINFEG